MRRRARREAFEEDWRRAESPIRALVVAAEAVQGWFRGLTERLEAAAQVVATNTANPPAPVEVPPGRALVGHWPRPVYFHNGRVHLENPRPDVPDVDAPIHGVRFVPARPVHFGGRPVEDLPGRGLEVRDWRDPVTGILTLEREDGMRIQADPRRPGTRDDLLQELMRWPVREGYQPRRDREAETLRRQHFMTPGGVRIRRRTVARNDFGWTVTLTDEYGRNVIASAETHEEALRRAEDGVDEHAQEAAVLYFQERYLGYFEGGGYLPPANYVPVEPPMLPPANYVPVEPPMGGAGLLGELQARIQQDEAQLLRMLRGCGRWSDEDELAAEALLESVIGAERYDLWKRERRVWVESRSRPDVAYEIRPGMTIQLWKRIGEHWYRVQHSLCVHPKVRHPAADEVATQVVLCERDETTLWEAATFHHSYAFAS